MELTDQQKKNLRRVYLTNATPEERDALVEKEKELTTKEFNKHLARLTMGGNIRSAKLDNITSKMESIPEGFKALSQELAVAKSDIRRSTSSATEAHSETVSELQNSIIKGLRDLKEALSASSSKSPIPADWSGFFKDGPTMLAQIGKNTGSTSELIRNLKWNASQQIRDVNGSPINPAIAAFGISGTYDDVVLTYSGTNLATVTYKQNGNVKAVLTLSYDGSSNLTEVVRTT